MNNNTDGTPKIEYILTLASGKGVSVHRDSGDGTPACGARSKAGWTSAEGQVWCYKCDPRDAGYWR